MLQRAHLLHLFLNPPSIALVPIIGLLLYYTPWGISVTPIVLSLLALTIVFATAAIIRENQAKTSETSTRHLK